MLLPCLEDYLNGELKHCPSQELNLTWEKGSFYQVVIQQSGQNLRQYRSAQEPPVKEYH